MTPHLVGPRRLLKEWPLGGAPQLAPGLAILCMLLLVLAVLLVLGCALRSWCWAALCSRGESAWAAQIAMREAEVAASAHAKAL